MTLQNQRLFVTLQPKATGGCIKPPNHLLTHTRKYTNHNNDKPTQPGVNTHTYTMLHTCKTIIWHTISSAD